ncbi:MULTISPECIES: dTMP kinase [Rhizobium]|uniref:Thymidylate kinase n=1 Tax=Rhizobium wuzhouense TaxID=1986026 RepID=A0ABX5NXE6_9HYPH|nr:MULTISPECIES: dTMP kinase [Rhizobium]PYB75077.1 dTMP kinase [Rhizobium wuzhouense]RKE84721.1 thymidylate kinase [Rhizobium sp. AG855]
MATGPGLFVSFEGGEGAGKSTQIRLLAEALRERGHDVVVTREPGGSPGAEALRHVLLSGAAEPFGIRMEALLFAAARADHLACFVRPALARGQIVLCDRFVDSSRVYQGVTGNLEPKLMAALERVSVAGTMPDLTLILDLPAEMGLDRARRRAGATASAAQPDRFEKERTEVHEKRRQGFLDIAAREPLRCRVIDASLDMDRIARDILADVTLVLAQRRGQLAEQAAHR